MSEPSDGIEPTRLVIQHLPTQAEIDAFVQSMDNCFIDTADYGATMALARNTGTAQDMETIFEKLAKQTTVPMATGKSRAHIVFVLDSLGALEDKKC